MGEKDDLGGVGGYLIWNKVIWGKMGWEVFFFLIDLRYFGYLVSSFLGIIYEVFSSKDINFVGNLYWLWKSLLFWFG